LVEGLKKQQFNLGESTNNCLENFFQKLNMLVKVRLNMPDFISALMSCIKFQRQERRHQLVTSHQNNRTLGFQQEHEGLFYAFVTKYDFKKIKLQMDFSKQVTVIDEHSVTTSSET
jgi:hypothetical protein